MGAAVVTTGLDGINWGGLDGWHPVGVFGVLIALAVSPVIGFVFGTAVTRLVRRRRPQGDAPPGRAGAGRRVGHVGRALVQPRRQRRPEGDGRHGRASGRGRPARHALGAALGQGRLGGDAHARHRDGRVDDRPHDRPAHLPPAPDRRVLEPVRLDGRDPRLVVCRCARCRPRTSSPRRWSASGSAAGAGAMYAGRSCAPWDSDGSRRSRRPPCSAPSSPSSGTVSREHAALVPAADSRRARRASGTDRRDRGRARRARRMGRRRRERPRPASASASTSPTTASASCDWRSRRRSRPRSSPRTSSSSPAGSTG